jgi:hypothetical protein
MSSSRLALIASIVAVHLVHAMPAHADSAAAQVAFDEAKRLMAKDRIDEACRKFELSYKEDPQLGVLLNLADCHEQLGKLASAWAEFRAAMELAKNKGDQREAFARQRSDDLQPRLAQIVLVRDGAAEGLRVELDGRDVSELVGVPMPIDPGNHSIKTRVGDGPEGSTTIGVKKQGRTYKVQVPIPVSGAETQPDEPEPTTPTSTARRKRHLIAGITGGAGLVLTGVGLYFGGKARSSWSDSRAYCDSRNICEPQGAALIDDAKSAALTSNVLVGLGVAALATGAILWVTAPAEGAPRVTARAIVSPQVAGAALTVQF